jgi:hypothetical protein
MICKWNGEEIKLKRVERVKISNLSMPAED